MLKVYFDSKPLSQGHAVRGVGYYTKNLLDHLRKDKNLKLVESPENADVVHFPYFDLFFNTLKPVQDKKNVVTVFDVIPLLYPKQYPPGLKGRLNLFRQKKALKKVDAIITISETSKKDIIRFLNVPANKVHPVHLAAQSGFRKLENGNYKMEIIKRYKLPNRFVLYVGDVNYNKNLLTLVKACLMIGVPLVIVGKQATSENVDFSHPENKSFGEFLKKHKDKKNIIRLGFVETDDLVSIYNMATVYCQPSLYEGFGLPILEAQACGTPVVASRIQAHVEIAQKSCLFVQDVNDVQETAEKITQIMQDTPLMEKLVKAGLKNAKKYSWKKTLRETVEVYKQC